MRISDWSSDVGSSDLRLRLEPIVHHLADVAAVADRPDDEARAAHDVAGGEHAVEVGHHPAIDEQGAPARDAEFGRIEHHRQILGIEAERLDDELGRASCRERGCQYVLKSVAAGLLKTKKITER